MQSLDEVGGVVGQSVNGINLFKPGVNRARGKWFKVVKERENLLGEQFANGDRMNLSQTSEVAAQTFNKRSIQTKREKVIKATARGHIRPVYMPGGING